MKRGLVVLSALLLSALIMVRPSSAQGDGLNLPTELYILLNAGEVQRYGVGRMGVTTVTPTDAFVVDFATAPDGNWLAYRTDSGLYLQDMAAPDAEPTQLEDSRANFPPIRQGGQTMTWSPDGNALAYTTEYGARVAFGLGSGTPRFVDIPLSPLKHLAWSPDGSFLAAEAENNVWWVYRWTGDTMTLTSAIPSSYGTAWLDAGRLVFAPAEGGLQLMDLNNANAQTTLRPAAQVYRRPYVRPDGDIVVFSGAQQTDSTATEDAAQGFYQRLRFDGAAASVVETGDAPVDVSSAHWAPGGELLVDFRGGVLALVRPVSGQGFSLPTADVVGYDWGPPQPEGTRSIATSENLYFRAPDTFGVTQVWQLPANGDARTQITESAFDVTAFAVNTAGTQVAYVSGGTLSIISMTEGTRQRELARVNETAADLRFNADGSALVYTTANMVDGGVWRVEVPDDISALPAPEVTPEATAEAGAAALPESTPEANPRAALPDNTQLIANNDGTRYRAPQFAPNINALLVAVAGDSARTYAVYDPTADALLTLGDYQGARWLRDGRVLAWGDEQLVTIDPANEPVTPSPVLTLEGQSIVDARAVDAQTVRLIVEEAAALGPKRSAVLTVPLSGGAPQAVGSIGYVVNPRLSADGAYAAGLNRPGGRLLISNLNDGTQNALASPTGVVAFTWQRVFN